MSHINLAISEPTFKDIFEKLRDSIAISTSDSGSFGPFSASYNAGIKLENGDIDLRDAPDRVLIDELDVVLDPLSLNLDIDIPEVCIGGFCILASFCWMCSSSSAHLYFFCRS